MTEYVKVCPKCAYRNPEGENTCRECGHFLGLIRAEYLPDELDATDVKREIEEITGNEVLAAAGMEPEVIPPAGGFIYLDNIPSRRSFLVRDGDVVGQMHPSNQAEVQLEGLENLNYVSRRHCRFTYENGAWFVTSLLDALNGSSVNNMKIATGGKVRIRNGDELMMAIVPFRVRIFEE